MTASSPPRLGLQGLAVRLAGVEVVSGVSLELPTGEFGCLLGPSGCGKTTLLRAIAGFEPLSAGEVRIDGACIAAPGRALPPEARRVGMVFQEHALFPHLDVAGNVGFGLAGRAPDERRARVSALLDLVGLAHVARAMPHALSGGQQQRVALARALAPAPALLLLDEPFANLDARLRRELATEVRGVLERERVTALMVTHDAEEAFALADRIGVMRAGRLLQWDTPYRLYHEPVSPFVASFIGEGVLCPGVVGEDGRIHTELGTLGSPASLRPGPPGRRVQVLIRPDDLLHDDASPTRARVVRRSFRGASFLYTLALDSGLEVQCLVASHHDHAVGDAIGIVPAVDHVVAFEAAGPDSG